MAQQADVEVSPELDGLPQLAVAPEADWLDLANLAYEGSTSYLDTNFRAQWERNLRQFRSQHRAGSKYLSETWRGKSRFFRPKTRAAERKSEASCAAAFFSTADVVDITATDDNDDIQQASALFWKHAIDYRLTKSVPWFLMTMGAYQDTQVMGACVAYNDWDFENDRPGPEIIPLENMRIDPAARWTDPINTSPYLIHLLPMYVHEVRTRWPQASLTDGELLAARTNEWDSTRLVREGQRTDPKEGANTGITDFDVVWVRRVFMRRDGQDWVYYTLAHQKMLSPQAVPVGELYPWLKARLRPYVMGISVIEAHRNYPAGPIELAAPVQDEINELVNQRRDNVRLVLDKRYLVKRHKQVDLRSLSRNLAGSSTLVDDPESDVRELEWNDVTSSAYQEEDRLNLDHDDLMGTFSGSSVASNRKLNETVGGMNLLSTELNEVGDYTLKTFTESFYEPELQQILWLEQYYESDAVLIALAGKKAGLVQKFGIDTVTDQMLKQQLTLTINVGLGATNPINSLERFMMALQKLTEVYGPEMVAQRTDFNAVSSEVFGKLGYKDGARFMLNQDDPRVASLMQTIQELQQKLQQKKSPELDKADTAKRNAEAVKTMVEAMFGATQAAQIIAAIPETAAVADEVLRSSGYPTGSIPGEDPNLPTPVPIARPTLGAASRAPATAAGGDGNVVPIKQNTSPQQPPVPATPTGMGGIEGG